MTFHMTEDGFWLGRFMYNGRELTAKNPDLFRCIHDMGKALNTAIATGA